MNTAPISTRTVEGIDGSGLRDLDPPRNAIDASHPQLTNFGNWYKLISECNTYLYYDEQRGDIIDPTAREYLLGMVYGMRAYAFFQVHKIYGTGPLRTTADVVLGNYDDNTLKMPRCEAEDLLNQIKSDVQASISHFNAGSGYSNGVFNANKGVYYFGIRRLRKCLQARFTCGAVKFLPATIQLILLM